MEQQRFRAELRRWRLLRQMSQRDLAERTLRSREWVTKVEQGTRWTTGDFAHRADLALNTAGVLRALWPAVEAEWSATRSRQPDELAPVLPLWHANRNLAGTTDEPASDDPLAALVTGILRDSPGTQILILSVNAAAQASITPGDDGRGVVVRIADFRTGTRRGRQSGGAT